VRTPIILSFSAKQNLILVISALKKIKV